MTTRTTRWRSPGCTLLLAVFAFVVAGYHPYAEDGGVYMAGVEKLLDPELFPAWTAFVVAPSRFSLFAPLVAGLVRITHVPLSVVLLAIYFAGIWTTLAGGWMVAVRCVTSLHGRLGAVVLLAGWLTLPVAGTSLILMDPYVTARTISTPLILIALALALDRRAISWWFSGLALAGATVVHPLMAGYGLAAILLVAVFGARRAAIRRWGAPALGLSALTGAAVVQALAPAENANYVRIAMTRYYWFLSRWHWFEWLGLLGPVVVLAGLCWWRSGSQSSCKRDQTTASTYRVLTAAIIALAAIALAVAYCFARETLPTHLVARMQPLRCFQQVYEVMALLLGAWLGETLLRDKLWRWAMLLAVLGGLMSFVQQDIYSHSDHTEWPRRTPENAWQQAFVWVRQNTPVDAVFALDARYITQGHGEDAQCFRALAERSALPDYSKDGGEAAIAPDLTLAWLQGQAAQTDLEAASDAERSARIKPLGANWIVLERRSATHWHCPYANEQVKVCHVP